MGRVGSGYACGRLCGAWLKGEKDVYAEMTLPEFEREMAVTRRVLERVPEDRLDWKPCEKSNTIGWNANHLAEIPGWAANILTEPFFDMNPTGSDPYRTPELRTRGGGAGVV